VTCSNSCQVFKLTRCNVSTFLPLLQLHDLKQHSTVSNTSISRPSAVKPRPTSDQATPLFSSSTSSSAATFSAPNATTSWAFPFLQSTPEVSETVTIPTTQGNLNEPLLQHSSEDPVGTEASSGHAQTSSPGTSTGTNGYPFQEASGDHTVVELH